MTSRWLWVCASALLLVSLQSQSAHAQDEATKAQARENFQRGIEQYDASQYEAALESFQEAYRLSPHPMVRVNMANCYDRLGKPVEALFHYGRFLSETVGDRTRAAQRTEVESAMQRLKRSLGELNLRVIPDGSLVRVDDTEERRSPIVEPLVLAAGDHVIRVTRQGFVPAERRVVVRGGASETIDITLQREQVAGAQPPVPPPSPPSSTAAATRTTASAPPPPPPPRTAIAPLPEETDTTTESDTTTASTNPPPSGDVQISVAPLAEETAAPESTPEANTIFTPPVIVAGVVSGTALLAAAVFGVKAISANNDFDDFAAQSNNPALPMRERMDAHDAALDAADRADSNALRADLFLGVAVIAGGVAAYFIVTRDEPGEEATVTAAIGPGSVVLSGRF